MEIWRLSFKRWIIKRAISTIPVLFFVILLNFVIIHMAPGDVAVIMGGEGASPEFLAAVRLKYGLDKPLYEQFVLYLTTLLRGDLGTSFVYGRPVINVIMERLPNSVLLIVCAFLFAIVGGTLAGTYAARHIGTKRDFIIMYLGLTAYSTPLFWLGILLVLVFGLQLRWFPIQGMTSVGGGSVIDILWHLCLPVLAAGLTMFGQYVRIARASIIEVMREDFITATRAIGFHEMEIFVKHGLRNALLPVVSLAGVQMTWIVTGFVLTETVFGWPGMGRLVFDAILTRDYPLILGILVIASVVVVVFTLIIDIIYALLDPRIVYK
jgi:peptide/nickel transport system permease protein